MLSCWEKGRVEPLKMDLSDSMPREMGTSLVEVGTVNHARISARQALYKILTLQITRPAWSSTFRVLVMHSRGLSRSSSPGISMVGESIVAARSITRLARRPFAALQSMSLMVLQKRHHEGRSKFRSQFHCHYTTNAFTSVSDELVLLFKPWAQGGSTHRKVRALFHPLSHCFSQFGAQHAEQAALLFLFFSH